MRDLNDAIDRACGEAGINTPHGYREGSWVKTDTFARNGRGDGRVFVGERVVIAHNWQTGVRATARIGGEIEFEENRAARAAYARRMERERRRRQERAEEAARFSARLIEAATLATHPYLALKGFPKEKALTVSATAIPERARRSLVPEGAERAVLVPARIGTRVSSAQLIWETGTKRFLLGGVMGGAVHRLARGADTWLCEGYATALSVREALRGMRRSDGVLVCFSAANIVDVARALTGRGWIAADNDTPIAQYDGLGAGEFFARRAERPFVMPPDVGDDMNDLHLGRGIFAVQALLGRAIRGAST